VEAETHIMRTKEKTILIIDDDRDFRASVGIMLESQGYKTVEAASAKEGLAKISEQKPDLVILDIMMEHDSAGYEVNQAVKFRDEFRLARSVPIIMVSSIPLDPVTRFDRAAEVGMITPDYYLTKPLNLDAFVSQVQKLLDT